MKKYLKSPILWVVIVAACAGWGIYEYQENVRLMEEARRRNEEWAEEYKYPWRKMELKSSDDVIRGVSQISNSDLSPEEKTKEQGQLWSRYQNEQQQKK